jgi:hypothetical protein
MQRYDNKSERLYKRTFRDFSIFPKTARAAYQVKRRITGFIENRMHVGYADQIDHPLPIHFTDLLPI